MSTTEHPIIERDISQPYFLSFESRQTSVKSWTHEFNSINAIPHPPTRVAFDRVFGDFGPDDEDRWEVEGDDPTNIREWVKSEADVARLFCKQISDSVMALWYNNPEVRELYECIPARMIDEDPDFTGKVDCSFMTETPQTTGMPQTKFFDFAVVEFKAPGVIDSVNWTSGSLSTGDKRLARELRGYAYKYRCPQICCYDGVTMLVIRFRAMEKYGDIKTCDADVFVLGNIAYAGGVHLRYALYRIIADGVRRVMASQANVVQILPWKCRREWFSGKPYWVHETQPNARYNTVPNITRKYSIAEKRWYWENSGVFVGWCSSTKF